MKNQKFPTPLPGWKLVPCEPTREMYAAVMDGGVYYDNPEKVHAILRAEYQSMIDAAPQPPEQARHVDAIPSKEALTDLIAQGLNGTYHCTRVWSAWGVGTMSENDFAPVDESETPGELADAVLAMLAAQQPLARGQAEPVAVIGDAYSLLWAFTGAFPDFAKRHDLKVGTTLYAHPAPQPTKLVNDLLGVLRGAEKWISLTGHGDNCFVSDHYEGDPGNRCNCGLDGLLSAIQAAIDKATGTEGGAA